MSPDLIYWICSERDWRTRKRCSACGAKIAHGLLMERALPEPAKRGCVGGKKRLTICDACVNDIIREGYILEMDRPQDVVRGCSCRLCRTRRRIADNVPSIEQPPSHRRRRR